jgi:chlorite dismutase
MTVSNSTGVIPAEGWHVLHLFYRVEHGQWALLSPEERITAKTNLTEVVQDIREAAETQLLIFSMVSPKADIGFLLLTPDLHLANTFEKRLTLSLGPDVLTPVYSFLSLTELSEYTSSEEEQAAALKKEQHLEPSAPGFETKLAEIKTRAARYRKEKLYPLLPTWEVFGFYPMSKRRAPGQNWYALPFEQRKELMAGHARIGRAYHGKILQLITGCTGLDDA